MAKVSDTKLAEWLEQVADALDGGLPASEACSLARPLPANLSRELAEKLANGATWKSALVEVDFPMGFAEMAIVEASSLSGSLPDALRKIAANLRARHKTRRKLLLSLAYPVGLIHFAAVAFPLGKLVEGDAAGYLFSAGAVLLPFWLFILGGRLILMAWPGLGRRVGRVLPFVGPYVFHRDMAVFTETLSHCVAAGMPPSQSWELACQAVDSPRLYSVGDSVLAALASGAPASEGMASCKRLLPDGFLAVYQNGEKTGTLDRSLRVAAERYRSDSGTKLFIATAVYSKLIMLAIFGYVAYRILQFFSNHYDQLMEINM